MAASSTVTTGDIATAANYNNLRADVLSNSASHTHTGASDNGVKVNSNDLQGTTLASTVVASSLPSVGTLTTLTVDNIIINGTNIGHTSDTDAIAIASNGVVTMNQIPVFSAGINVSGGTIAGTLATAAQANITSVGTLTSLTMGGNVNLGGAGTVYGVLEVSGNDGNSARLIGNEAASATNPTLVPDRSEEATGIGGTSTYVSSIVSGTERIRATTTGATVTGNASVVTGSGTAAAHTSYDDLVIKGGDYAGITIGSNTTTGYTSVQFGDSGGSTQGTVGYAHNGDYLYFRAGANDVARMYSTGLYMQGNDGIYDVGHADSAWTSSGLIVGAGDIKMMGGSGTTILTDGTYIRRDNGAGDLFFDSQGSVRVNIDTNANNTDKKFSVGGDASASDLFSVAENGNVTITDGTLYVDAGTTNTVAALESSDANAIINILDSSSDTSYPPGILVTANDMYLRGGTQTGQGLGLRMGSDGDTLFYGASYNLRWDASDNALEFADGAVAKFGTGVDMTIGHSSNANTITLANDLTITGANVLFANNYLFDVGNSNNYWDNSGMKIESTSAGTSVYIKSSAANGYPSVRFVNDAQEWRVYAPDGSTNDGYHVYDGTNSKYRFSIGTGGEIGFNTPTFDSWITTAGSGYTPVFLGSKQSSIHGTNYDTTGSWTGWQQNAYLDSGDSRWEYVTTGAGASNIYQYNGNIYFRAAASGTADAAITWSIPLHINTSGVTLNNFALYDVGHANSEWSNGWLNVAGTANSFIDIRKEDAGTGNLRWMNGVNEMFRLWLDNAEARLAISSDSGSNNVFYVERSSGDTYTNDGTIHSISDSRLKKEIVSLDDGLSIINQLRPVTYKYNGTSNMVSDDDVVRYGLVADEVQSVASQYVKTISAEVSGKEVDDLKTLSTTNMIPMLIKAVQELSERVETLES